MKISSGIVTIDVERDGQAAGSFSFNPENTSFRERVYKLFEDFREKEKELQKKDRELQIDTAKDEDGMPLNIKAAIELEKETFQWTTQAIDSVFGEGTSAVAFGEEINLFMLYQFMDEIAPYMEEAGGAKIERYVMNREQRRAAQKGKKVMR
jgi:hypothetical protein